ncbi:MAG: tRNA guanosine(34) transglycosylase Tgt [Candidatus Colwellbacteria bacterium]|nr:tRNA guanosine(34) transglycosylase Tgt [Candidatus Colwellbacteria bacterium]
MVKKQLHKARLTELTTPHGKIPGPFFQFVATQAVIRGAAFAEDLEKMGVDIVLANTYHLHLRPGEDIVAEAGGLHGFMQWPGPITTDSGGYQVFSLGNNRTSPRLRPARVKLTADSVTFRAPLDGNLYEITPEKAMQIQAKLGADIIMPLDVCTPFGATQDDVAAAITQTTAWARRCVAEFKALGADTKQTLYGIVQGGVYPELRKRAAQEIGEIGFFGYAIGGELREGTEKRMAEIAAATTPYLPKDAPRYLMGCGGPADIVAAVREGVDQFDCVLPVRNARHGQLFYDLNREELRACLQDPQRPVDSAKLYRRIDITKSDFARDFSLFSPGHPVIQKPYTKAYVHHLMRAEVPSATRLTVMHNVYFYVQLMKAIQETIEES